MIRGYRRTARRSGRIGRALFAAGLIAAWPALEAAAAVSPNIRVNQIGFHPQDPKKGVVAGAGANATFFIATADLSDTVFQGDLGPEKTWAASQEAVRLADFSSVTSPGQYVLGVPGMGTSYPFSVSARAHLETTRGAIRSYFYQRAGAILTAANAGKWARNAGHPDNRVAVHASAASETRPAETVISAGKGWYDAGDYGKYVVNSGITTYTLMALYQHYPAFFDSLNLNIPESGNTVPDLLDEVLWNLRFMLAMQDPNDGGAYHKLTTADFSGMVMPEADIAKRYVVKKSVTATLDLAATAAYASRVFRKFDTALPGFADSCLAVARKAWTWARANPTAFYRQADINRSFSPQITTGEYGDGSAVDEQVWAGIELYLATKEDSFYVAAVPGALPTSFSVPGWNNVLALAIYSLADAKDGGYSKIDAAAVTKMITTVAGPYRARADTSAYAVPISNEFYWGSNSVAGNQGMLLLQAFRQTGDSTYLRAAVSALDYLLGRNATGYSFVTGYGSKTPMAPHHRPSSADGVREPVPGFIVGGPNPGQDDKCAGYPSKTAALSYLDTECSYSTNEVAINWNAPYAYLAGGLEAILGAGAPGTGIRAQSALPRTHALLYWEGGNIKVTLPEGWTGRVELFDIKGAQAVAEAADTAGGLRIYRLKARDRAGREVIRNGTLSPYATARVGLGR